MKKLTIAMIAVAALLFAGSAFAHNVAVTAPGLNGTGFKLEMQYTAASAVEASVVSSHPDSEEVYRASFVFHMTSANAGNMQNPSFTYIFQTFATGFFTGPTSWGLRLGIHRVNGNTNLRLFGRDNQANRRGTGNCLVPEDEDVTVEINWQAAQANGGTLRLDTFEGGSATPSCTRNVIGGITNGFVRTISQLFVTKPDAATTVSTDFTVYVDEFASFRTLSPAL